MFWAIVLLFLCLLAGGSSTLVGVAAWRQRSYPGARWFAVLMGGIALWSFSYGVSLLVFDPSVRRLFEVPAELAQAVIAPAWVLFVLAYTGRDQLLSYRLVALLSVVPGVTLGLVFTTGSHDLLWTNYRLVETFGLATVRFDSGPWFYFHAVYGYALIGSGLALLLEFLLARKRLYATQATVLVVGALVSTVGHAVWVLQLGPVPQINFAPIALAATGAMWAYGLFRFELLERAPAAARMGRRAAVDDLSVGVATLDRDGRIVDTNHAARAVLGDDAVGSNFSSRVPVSRPPSVDPQLVTVSSGRVPRTYEVTASPIADRRGRPVAETVTLRDVTERERQRQRLEVLNRVLRHNLRNELTVVLGYADTLAGELDDDHARMAETVERRSRALLSVGEKARAVERALDGVAAEGPDAADGGEAPTTSLPDVVDSIVDRGRSESPESTLTRGPVEGVAVGPRRTVEAVVWNLVENALVHGGEAPTVEVSARADGDTVTVTVTDDGPGVPEHELSPLEAGTESALEHGSGVGLWLVTWGTQSLGGDVDFETDDGGTTATVRLPRASA